MTHKRGALLLEGWRARWAVRRARGRHTGAVTLAGVNLPPADETKHFKLIGVTGAGKSTAIRELLAGALERGDRAIIADPDGGYLDRFHDRYRGDVILNPFEAHSLRWDVFAEIEKPYDIEQLASSLIPAGEDATAREWRGYARTFLAAVLRDCLRRGRREPARLWRLLAMADSEELRTVVADTPAQPFLEPDNARMFGSIRSVAVAATAAFEHVQAQRAAGFSVRGFVRGGRGVLFMPYRAGQIPVLRSMISTWMRLAIVETLNGTPDRDRRLWFVVDELDALGAIDGLKDALARLRKFGGRCVLAWQSMAQVSQTYGAGEAQTLVENCGNTLILRCSSGESGGTSQFASRLIGEREIVRRQVARGREGLFSRSPRLSTNVSEQHILEAALLPAQLEQLPDLTGYLKTASSPAWIRVRLAA